MYEWKLHSGRETYDNGKEKEYEAGFKNDCRTKWRKESHSWVLSLRYKLYRKTIRKWIESFSCGCKELDDFFHDEVFICAEYCYISPFCAKNEKGEIIALFTLANDSIVIGSQLEKQDFVQDVCYCVDTKYIDTFEKQSSFPAVNIGHLAVRTDCQNKNIGKDILDFVINTFTDYKVAGCQFITVDSLNNSRTNKFYMQNGFLLQTDNDATMLTRRMFIPINMYRE